MPNRPIALSAAAVPARCQKNFWLLHWHARTDQNPACWARAASIPTTNSRLETALERTQFTDSDGSVIYRPTFTKRVQGPVSQHPALYAPPLNGSSISMSMVFSAVSPSPSVTL